MKPALLLMMGALGCAAAAESAPASAARPPSSASSPGSDASGAARERDALVDCDPAHARCQTLVAVECPARELPSIVNACYGPCVPRERCAPFARAPE